MTMHTYVHVHVMLCTIAFFCHSSVNEWVGLSLLLGISPGIFPCCQICGTLLIYGMSSTVLPLGSLGAVGIRFIISLVPRLCIVSCLLSPIHLSVYNLSTLAYSMWLEVPSFLIPLDHYWLLVSVNFYRGVPDSIPNCVCVYGLSASVYSLQLNGISFSWYHLSNTCFYWSIPDGIRFINLHL